MERLVNRGTKTYRKSTRNVVERREIRHTNKNDGRTTIERKRLPQKYKKFIESCYFVRGIEINEIPKETRKVS